jgi:hypothetical protein
LNQTTCGIIKIEKKCRGAHVSGVTRLYMVGPKIDVESRFYKYNEYASPSSARKKVVTELCPKGKGKGRGYLQRPGLGSKEGHLD